MCPGEAAQSGGGGAQWPGYGYNSESEISEYEWTEYFTFQEVTYMYLMTKAFKVKVRILNYKNIAHLLSDQGFDDFRLSHLII